MSKDLFSKQSGIYARYRPGYPAGLVTYILQFVSERKSAWDCATGNGQAAKLLAEYFEEVHATDLSEKQIANAIPDSRIQYAVSPAEKTGFATGSFDLVTVAQAYHWFNFESFERELRRVLKPNGVIAVWGYGMVKSQHEPVTSLIERFYHDVVGPYWDGERQYVDNQYRTIPFPYDELPPAEFSIDTSWTIEELIGYLNTWSSVQHFIKANSYNPVGELEASLQQAWPLEKSVAFQFPLFLRLGRILGK